MGVPTFAKSENGEMVAYVVGVRSCPMIAKGFGLG